MAVKDQVFVRKSFSGVLYVSDSGNNRIQKLGNPRKNPPEAIVDHPTLGRPFL